MLEKLGADSATEAAALLLLLGYMAVAPIPYGAITNGATAVLECVAFTVLALAVFSRPRYSRLGGVARIAAMTAGVALLGVVQLLPLPQPILSIVSPESARIYRDASDTLRAFGRPAPLPRISIAPTETLDAILLTLAYLAFFVAAVLLLRSRKRRRLFATVLLTAVVLHIVIAAIFRNQPTGEDPTPAGRLHGAFVNANHFAGYLSIALAVAFGLLWREVLHARESRGRERGARFETAFMRVAPRIVLWAVIAAGIGLTQSRGGIVAAALTTVILLIVAPSHPLLRNRRWTLTGAAAGVVAAGIGFALATARQQPVIRFLTSDPRDPMSDLRPTLWRLSIDAWTHFPILGSGLGTFREAFRRVQPRDLAFFVEFAHSDSLQLLVAGGIVGLMLGGGAFLMLMIALMRAWKRQQHREESAMILAAFGAMLCLAIHGVAEFNLSVPAIPATLACVAGFGWAASQVEDEDAERRGMRLVRERSSGT